MILKNIFLFVTLFLLWTLLVYLMHRLAHIRHRANVLYYFHVAHHKVDYLKERNRKFKWYYLLFYFGGIRETLDVILILTIPLLIVCFIYPPLAVFLIGFHYIYEVFLSEGLLDHNPSVKGKVTQFFSWGNYHLTHHKTWRYNFSLMITLWDYVFKTKK